MINILERNERRLRNEQQFSSCERQRVEMSIIDDKNGQFILVEKNRKVLMEIVDKINRLMSSKLFITYILSFPLF